ncbi:aldehyde dehydrogenase family domain-containing protein [Hirsutella rhossiliensis]|uniref:aldehyde dehydrogenase (NAD(+)) n=1 Tax=Hirsutella rhossiliensis TaxID=111463 RepID=A0A9P8SBT9_9HYPO|nr:aldehyde dehydrogenase family domain-containing protein [Hirsutella rhossiliensis]KAH0956898.1 aldehyde dehydrogenase family domain-containing protein [Hirsutella rhossiliensis]
MLMVCAIESLQVWFQTPSTFLRRLCSSRPELCSDCLEAAKWQKQFLLALADARSLSPPAFSSTTAFPATRGETIDLENPATGKFLAKVAAAQVEDVDRAVSSSADAFKSTWRFVTPDKSRSLLNKLADLLERDAEDLASIEALDAGMLYRGSLTMSIPQAAETCRYYAGWVGKRRSIHEYCRGMAYTRREPIGVCAAIVPWNAPLMITMWKLAPAIAAGNTVIVKTPEIAPLYAQKLAQLIREAGFPPGVVNIVCGLGQVAGQALADHMLVRKISFTGSTAVGRRILESSARTNLKKVTVELGGKGPSIVFADASWENALLHTTMGITVHNGQICAAGSRIYVQDEIYDRYVAEFSARTKDSVAGDPLAGQHHQGSLVASIARFKTEEEVVGLANDTNYGLSAAVFTDDINKAMRVSDAIECGQESGFGRDLGQEALEEWTQVKCVKFSIVHKL